MTTDRCEIFHIRRKGKLRWKWRQTVKDGGLEVSEGEYELFYECLSAARKSGLTPTYQGLRLEQQPRRPDWVVTRHREARPAR